ncbi:MAG: class I SAM-dependent RNA methyltransferase [Ardenticatenaceae bacterium]|nr:class I SAM-dependent RNA methyltransferase [Ardenticatenaceae bacterium]MCB9446541.1 class I SAM-dependent RNA methyltransferase [Ardenticatenaceae bacterium]
MTDLTLTLTIMAHGGAAMGRDGNGRPVFIPYTIPGETVRARLTDEKRHYARAELLEIIEPSPDRVEPRCPYFGICGGCHFQHMIYERQLQAKQIVVNDQLQRIGSFDEVNVRPVKPNPTPWGYRIDASLSPVPGGGLGYWSPIKREVIAINTCPIIHPRLQELWQDVDLDLPGLRKLTLRVGDDEALLAALEINDVEPPELEADFPVSIAIVLPDQTAASLVGDNYIVQRVKGRDFRVSPGCFFQPSPAAAELLVDTVLAYVDLNEANSVIELYSGVGMLTAFLAETGAAVTAVELNPDAVGDTAVNLSDFDNVTLYEGPVEEILPLLAVQPDVMVVDPPDGGLSDGVIKSITRLAPSRLVYVSADLPALARDGKKLAQAGYQLIEVQPIDMTPQAFRIDAVSLWHFVG